MTSNYLWLLDNGHSGLIKGIYKTPGKRSPKWADGSQLYEGEFNRAIVKRLIDSLTSAHIDFVNIVPEPENILLKERVTRANSYHSKGKCIYLSIHANAGGGSGYEIFTAQGDTQADKIATVFYDQFKAEFPHAKMRPDLADGDVDKEVNYYVLKYTKMPAILTENFFMDNEKECKEYLMTQSGRDRIAKAHLNAILEIEKKGII